MLCEVTFALTMEHVTDKMNTRNESAKIDHVVGRVDLHWRTAWLIFATVRIEIDMAGCLSGSESESNFEISIRVNDIDEFGVRRIQTNGNILWLKEWTRRIETWDTCELILNHIRS